MLAGDGLFLTNLLPICLLRFVMATSQPSELSSIHVLHVMLQTSQPNLCQPQIPGGSFFALILPCMSYLYRAELYLRWCSLARCPPRSPFSSNKHSHNPKQALISRTSHPNKCKCIPRAVFPCLWELHPSATT